MFNLNVSPFPKLFNLTKLELNTFNFVPSQNSFMVTLYLLSFKYFKLNISIMDYNIWVSILSIQYSICFCYSWNIHFLILNIVTMSTNSPNCLDRQHSISIVTQFMYLKTTICLPYGKLMKWSPSRQKNMSSKWIVWPFNVALDSLAK